MNRLIFVLAVLVMAFFVACAPVQPQIQETDEVEEVEGVEEEEEVEEEEVEEEEVEEEQVFDDLELEDSYPESSELNHILFAFDKFNLEFQGIAILDDFADIIDDYSLVEISVSGNTDERGSNAYNLALGEKRASAVRDYLVSLGFPFENIEVLSFGEEVPLCEEITESCWQENRRAEVIYYLLSE